MTVGPIDGHQAGISVGVDGGGLDCRVRCHASF
jgi:hypothetical protein